MGEPMTSADRGQHWDAAYRDRGETGVSWYQETPRLSVELVDRLGCSPGDAIVDVGGGASLFGSALIARGYTDVTVLDVSPSALELAQQRCNSPAITWIVADVLEWQPPRPFALWHDRAVFHFLVDPVERVRYLDTLRTALPPGGAVIVATFAADGPEFCSGLPVARYSPEQLSLALGTGFKVVEHRGEVHTTPGGATQRFTWVAARRDG